MRVLYVTVLLLTALVLPGTASADVFNLSTQNTPLLCSGSCGTVTVTFDAGTGKISFAINVSPDVLFGSAKSFGFNVVGTNTGVTFSNFSPLSGYSYAGDSGNMDNMGSYEFTIAGPTVNQGQTSLSFDVTRPGNVFTGVGDVYQASSGSSSAPGGGYFAAQIHKDQSGMPGTSGFAQTSTTPVPEPASVLLLSTAVGGAWLLRRKRLKA